MNAKVYCNGTRTKCLHEIELTVGMSGAPVEFDFSAEWDGLGKTAVFRCDGTKDVIIGASGTAVVPHEILITPGMDVEVGVYSVKEDGTTWPAPTTYCKIGRVGEGADPSGDESYPPTPDVGEQAVAAAGAALVLAQEAKESADSSVKSVNGVNPDANGNVVVPGGGGGGTTIELDTTLTQSGKAADAKAVGDALANVGGAAWLDPEPGEVFTVIVPAPTLTGIAASYTGGDVIIGTALSALVGVVVTASYSDGSTATVTGYTLSGEIAEGSNTITVTYEGMTATFTVTGVEEEPEVVLTGITAVYTGGNVTAGTALTELTGITVTANYSDGTTANVTDYTLSGEIVEGSNTITVSYGGFTTTFTVTGEAEAEPVEYNVYLETVDGVEYICSTDPSLAGGANGSSWLGANSYTNDTYTCYNMQAQGYNSVLDTTVAEPYGGVIPFAEGTNDTGGVLLNYAEEGEYCGGPGKGWWRLYNDMGEHETAEEYFWAKYGVLKMALKSTASRHTVDPSLITSITIQQNDDTWQYAQFVYAHGLESNVYRGLNTLTFRTAGNLNLSAATIPCAAMHANSRLSIKFKPGTFADFTLDAVKAFLTEHPLTFIY